MAKSKSTSSKGEVEGEAKEKEEQLKGMALPKAMLESGITLPEGWQVKAVKRQNGKTDGVIDYHWIPPQGGKPLRSWPAVLKHVKSKVD